MEKPVVGLYLGAEESSNERLACGVPAQVLHELVDACCENGDYVPALERLWHRGSRLSADALVPGAN